MKYGSGNPELHYIVGIVNSCPLQEALTVACYDHGPYESLLLVAIINKAPVRANSSSDPNWNNMAPRTINPLWNNTDGMATLQTMEKPVMNLAKSCQLLQSWKHTRQEKRRWAMRWQ